MIRTQIYLPKTLHRDIDLIAKREKKSKAQVIREAIKEHLEKKQPEETLGEALGRLIEVGKKLKLKGPTDLSTNHDKYLYED